MVRLACSFIFLFSVLYGTRLTKKEELLRLSKKYFPENYTVIKKYDSASIEEMAPGDSLKDYIFSVSTVVHEGYHSFQNEFTSYYDSVIRYRINDSLFFAVPNFKTFPSIEINKIVSPAVRRMVFRYDTYINTESKIHVTQQFGIMGLLEEMAAYYHSLATDIELFNYFKDVSGWTDPAIWIHYLGNTGGYRFAITEFELFISWYLQVAKTTHPSTYHAIVANKGLHALFSFLYKENDRLKKQYDTNRALILSQLGKKVTVMENVIFSNNPGHFGQGLFDKDVKDMDSLLQKPEHRILQLLLD